MRSDYTPKNDSDYAKGIRRWQGDFEGWAAEMKEGEWYWDSVLIDAANSFTEYQELAQASLPTAARWLRADGRSAD